ncbi:MAG: hypothetical protein PHX61_04700 [Alphaproteobacteria bacterium]|nr:hypothetical protein [Alphaproteobacteria bacterium]
MNIKLSAHSVTFKISEEELKSLLESSHLNETISVSGKHLSFLIEPVHSIEAEFILNENFSISLKVPDKKIQELAEIGKSRDGLCIFQKDINILLQVDVRSDTRSKREI